MDVLVPECAINRGTRNHSTDELGLGCRLASMLSGNRRWFPEPRPYVDCMSTAARRPVLLVDDDSDWRDLIEDHLHAAGLAVAAATDGRGAWQSFLKSEPVVVVTDIQMPFMDGRELLANVRARNFRVPVIVVTACAAQICTADLTSAYAVIAKPADPDEIVASVKRL